jgi:ribosome biogenesis GTPase
LPQGVIAKGIGGFYYIKTETGLYETKARGVFRKNEIVPLPGDRVKITILDESRKIGQIKEIMKRDNVLSRPAVANVNQMVIVISVLNPVIDFYLLDKLLITANYKGINPVICINKIDLNKNEEHEYLGDIYVKAGFDVFYTSSKTNEGFDILRDILINNITVFAGQSGVGKSTILNKVMNKLIMETSEISKKIKRGRHTTRHAELLQVKDGGFIVDTPGFSSFSLNEIKYNELERFYPEFVEFIGNCKFIGCSHIDEPSCAVKEALCNKIDSKRYER